MPLRESEHSHVQPRLIDKHSPNGIIWPNIRANAHLRATRYVAGYGILIILLVIYSGV